MHVKNNTLMNLDGIFRILFLDQSPDDSRDKSSCNCWRTRPADTAFNVARHIHGARLPPGHEDSHAALEDMLSDFLGRPLPDGQPLWEMRTRTCLRVGALIALS